MWSPTHVQVTVQRARNLRSKGRGSTNDAFVIIQMGKEKFQTSVKEKCVDPEWYEECDLVIDTQKESCINLTVFHRNLLGLDDFLGCVSIPLQKYEMSYEKRINKWHPLKGKSGKNEEKYRGDIEVCVLFVVRTFDTQSLNEFGLKNRRKSSIKEFASNLGHKLQKLPSRTLALRQDIFDSQSRLSGRLKGKRHSIATHRSFDSAKEIEDSSLDTSDFRPIKPSRKHNSIYSSTISLPQSAMITSSIKEVEHPSEGVGKGNLYHIPDELAYSMADYPLEAKKDPEAPDFFDTKLPNHGEWSNRISYVMKDLTKSEMNLSNVSRNENSSPKEKKNSLLSFKNSLRRHTLQLAEAPDLSALKLISNLKHCRDDAKKPNSGNPKDTLGELAKEFPPEVIGEYEKRSHQDLVALAVRKQAEVEKLQDKVADLENYLDDLLVRVMETTPRILQTPYKSLDHACSR